MRLSTLLIAFSICVANAYEGECGTMQVFQNILNRQKQPQYASVSYNNEKCSYEQYYDSVYSIVTPHIQVFYVLEGPHATTKAFADSTAASMEAAWDFYVNKLKMRAPKGDNISHHFRQEIKNGLYPIEIVDIDQVRDPENQYGCNSCFALTIPLQNSAYSQIFLDNDFRYGAKKNTQKEYFVKNGDSCAYSNGNIALHNKAHDFDYPDEWAKGIRLTIFHEFYHAIQLRYVNAIENHLLFWFEASATGFEEVTNPQIDDYFSYIPYLFGDMGIPLSRLTRVSNYKIYGTSTLFLYLYHKVSNEFDKSIWESFSQNMNKPFETHLETALKPFHLDADSIFHDYSVKLSLSGERSNSIPKQEWIIGDQSEWTSADFYEQDEIKPDVESLAFKFYRTPYKFVEPDFTDFVGKATVISYSNGEASIHKIKSNKTLDSLTSVLSTCDSSLWIFSRLGQSESIPMVTNNTAPHAFPVPWREGALCFAPLPRDKKYIEIRTRRGDLISQEKYEGTTYCLQEDQVKSMMAPGIYRFRVGNKGKTTSFIVVY